MNRNLLEGITFQIDETRRLGTMRIDWYDGRLCNQWNPTSLQIDLKTSSEIDLKKLQQELNYLQFELLPSFEGVEKFCGGTGYDMEKLFSVSMEIADYLIKLIPLRDAYSYIYVYVK